MTITIPYIFKAGTKAKAQEVNDNFTAIVTEVNNLSSDILENATDITTLRNTKADLNGNTNNRFSVANPVNSGDAVNKQTLISITGYGVFGLQLSKADETHITCTAGATWDSTQSKVLGFNEEQSIEFSTGSANTTYYVYIIGTADGLQTDLFVSTSSNNPPLPEGYTLFKQLGVLQTEEDSGDIYYVNNNGEFNQTLVLANYLPKLNYNGTISVGVNTTHTASSNGFIIASVSSSYASGSASLQVDNTSYPFFRTGGSLCGSALSLPVWKDQTYRLNVSGMQWYSLWFVPSY